MGCYLSYAGVTTRKRMPRSGTQAIPLPGQGSHGTILCSCITCNGLTLRKPQEKILLSTTANTVPCSTDRPLKAGSKFFFSGSFKCSQSAQTPCTCSRVSTELPQQNRVTMRYRRFRPSAPLLIKAQRNQPVCFPQGVFGSCQREKAKLSAVLRTSPRGALTAVWQQSPS
jgi:hypothetical protein